MALYVLPTGREALIDHCPESYLRATSWLAPKKEAKHAAPEYVKIHDWFKRTRQRTKHTPLLNPLMKGNIRSIIAWLKGNSFTVSSRLLHPKKASKD